MIESRPFKLGQDPAYAKAACLTALGRGAVATVRVRAASAFWSNASRSALLSKTRSGKPVGELEPGSVAFVRWGDVMQEDVVFTRESECEWEIHCHGGNAAVERILNDLKQSGCEVVPASEFLPDEQALLKLVWEAVTRATTARTADLLLQQAQIAWPRLLSLLDADSSQCQQLIDEALAWKSFGEHLTQPWNVALCGRPNAGKSSLMNALAGFTRSIVDPSAGTTRDAVTLDTAFEGWPVRLVDTAGIRETDDAVESIGVERAREAARSANLVLIVIDGSEPLGAADRGWLESWPDAIRVWNKNDLGGSEHATAHDVRVSATTGAGLEQLIDRMTGRLIPALPPEGQAVPVYQEQSEWLAGFPADAVGGLGERDQ